MGNLISSNFSTNVPLYAWVAFARTGDPNCESIGKWSVYGEKRLTMMLGKDCHVEKAPYEDERRTGTGVKRKSAMS